MTDRRAFLVMLLVACGCGPGEAPKTATRTGASASTTNAARSGEPSLRPARVALLIFGARDTPSVSSESAPVLVRRRLSELGYVEGRTIVVEDRIADGDARRLAQLAREIVDSKPDVIVTIAAAATAAVRQETSVIPIVMAHAGNPVGAGFVASLAHPGGNVTGTTSMISDLGVKQVEVLRELIPGIRHLGVLANPTNVSTAPLLADMNEAGQRFDIRISVAQVAREEDFDAAFDRLREARPQALYVMLEPFIAQYRERILDFAATNRLPASYDVGRDWVRHGGLISYGPVLTSHYALVADYVDKILKGARPGDLPVQQPTQFALVINLRAADALGITVPQSLLVRADEVIR